MKCPSVAGGEATFRQVKWFSFKHPKKSEIALIYLNWFQKLAPLSPPIRCKTKLALNRERFSSVDAVYLLGIFIVLLCFVLWSL